MKTKREHLADPRQVAQLLPDTRPIEVRHPDGPLCSISPLSVDEAQKLSDLGFALMVLTKHGYFSYMRLVVSVQAARRALKRSHKHAGERIPVAEDNYTIRRVSKPSGQYFEHRNQVCEAYARP